MSRIIGDALVAGGSLGPEALETRNEGKPSEQWTERPCVDCSEPTYNPRRCRECDLDHIYEMGSCRECGRFMIREDIAGPLEKQHVSGCSLAGSDDWRPPWRD